MSPGVIPGRPILAEDGVDPTVVYSATPGEIRPEWAGGVPTWSVYRGTSTNAVPKSGLLPGSTFSRPWVDTPRAGSVFF